MIRETIILPVVLAQNDEQLNYAQAHVPGSRPAIALRVALNPFEIADPGDGMPMSNVDTSIRQAAQGLHSRPAVWERGARLLLDSREGGGSAFTTLTAEEKELLTGSPKGNRGLAVNITTSELGSFNHISRRGYTSHMSHETYCFSYMSRVWQLAGRTAINDVNFAIRGAFKAPNGGGYVRLRRAKSS